MKKILCLLTALLLLTGSAALAEEEPLYPEGYDLLLIIEIFPGEAELDEDATEEELTSAPEYTLLQGTFGAVDQNDTSNLIGFDKTDLYTFGLAEGCVILLPADPLDPTEIVQIDDLQAWYDNVNEVMADYFDEGQTLYQFYITFELNDQGDFTKIEYMYFDWL